MPVPGYTRILPWSDPYQAAVEALLTAMLRTMTRTAGSYSSAIPALSIHIITTTTHTYASLLLKALSPASTWAVQSIPPANYSFLWETALGELVVQVAAFLWPTSVTQHRRPNKTGRQGRWPIPP